LKHNYKNGKGGIAFTKKRKPEKEHTVNNVLQKNTTGASNYSQNKGGKTAAQQASIAVQSFSALSTVTYSFEHRPKNAQTDDHRPPEGGAMTFGVHRQQPSTRSKSCKH
jgi:hypothetical protein